jgi:hypothetical protein
LHPTEKNIRRVGRRPEAVDSTGAAVGEEEKGVVGRTGAEEEEEEEVGQRGAEEDEEVARTGAEEEAEGVGRKGAKEDEGVGEEAAATRGAWPQTEINRGIELSEYDRLLNAATLYASSTTCGSLLFCFLCWKYIIPQLSRLVFRCTLYWTFQHALASSS